MSYTCRITAAVKDTSGDNANINATLVVSDDATGLPVLTRVIPTNGMNGDQLKAYGMSLLQPFLVRDSFYPTIKAAADAQFILAQG